MLFGLSLVAIASGQGVLYTHHTGRWWGWGDVFGSRTSSLYCVSKFQGIQSKRLNVTPEIRRQQVAYSAPSKMHPQPHPSPYSDCARVPAGYTRQRVTAFGSLGLVTLEERRIQVGFAIGHDANCVPYACRVLLRQTTATSALSLGPVRVPCDAQI